MSHLLVFGDGHAAAGYLAATERWPARLVESLRRAGAAIDLETIAGPWTVGELRRWARDRETGRRADLVVAQVGSWDVAAGTANAAFMAAFNELLDEAVAAAGGEGGRVLVATPVPHGELERAMMVRFNELVALEVQVVMQRQDIRWVDLAPAVLDLYRDERLRTADEAPSAAAHLQWAAVIAPAAESVLRHGPIARGALGELRGWRDEGAALKPNRG